MTFTDADVDGLVDEVLPGRFGGSPTDYQLVEREVDGLPRVQVVVSPRVGRIDEAAVVEVVLDRLARSSRVGRMMAEMWRSGRTVIVVRREPYAATGAKILPLYSPDRGRTQVSAASSP